MRQKLLTLLAAAMVMAALTAASVSAATMSSSLTAPAVDGLDIANYGTSTGTDKWWAENSAAGAAKGQTFLVGGDDALLNAITYQVADNQKAEPTKTYVIRVGLVEGNAFTEIYREEATQDFMWNNSEYMTWTFDAPVLLNANTQYGIDIGMTATTSGWQTGIPYIQLTENDYADGARYSTGTVGVGTDTLAVDGNARDRIFHLDMDYPVPPVIYPKYGEIVPPGDVTLQWENISDPCNPGSVTVDVWFGTDPNKDSENYTQVVTNGVDTTSVTVTPPGPGVYYWQVDTQMDPNAVEGTVYMFTNDAPVESVDIVADGEVTWLGQSVSLASAVVDDNGSALTYEWSYAEITDPNITVSLTVAEGDQTSASLVVDNAAPAGEPVSVTVTLAVNDEFNPAVSNSIVIDVYDNACLAARQGVGLDSVADYNKNCEVAVEDLAEMASGWLNDYAATEQVVADPGLTISGQFGILDLTANGGINPNTGQAWKVGDKYRLAFYTAGKIEAKSNDPAVYDAFATSEAAAAGIGGSWTAMVYVNTDGAQEQGVGPISSPVDRGGYGDTTGGAEVGGAGVPVYAMDGSTCIARNNEDILNNWSNPFDGNAVIRLASGTTNLNSSGVEVTASQNVHYSPFLDQYGLGDSANVHGTDCWTGGFRSHVNALGDTPSNVNASIGSSNANNAGRTWNRFTRDNISSYSVYAISEVLTVIAPITDAGDNISTWFGNETTLAPKVEDANDPGAVFEYSWTASADDGPELDIAFSDAAALAPTVTVTKVPYLKLFLPNGSFENVTTSGGQTVQSYRDYWGQYDRPAGATVSARQYVNNPAYHFPDGVMPDGDIMLRANSSTSESRPDGAAMLLDVAYDPTATYELSVAVGRPLEVDPPNPNNYTDANWRGYLVQLVVGGQVESTGSGPDNIYGGTVVAEDANSIEIPQREWVTSVITLAPSPELAHLAGQPIQIRLLTPDDADPAYATQAKVFYDNAVLTINGETGVYVTDPGTRTVNLTLAANKVGETETHTDRVQIDVYENACEMAKTLAPETIEVTDHNLDCITNLVDFADIAADWLLDYALTEPGAKQ